MFFSRRKFPSSETLEKEEKQKNSLYHEFLETQDSDILKEYNSLAKVVNSSEFKDEKNRLLKLKYKRTKEYALEKELRKLSKNKQVKAFLKDSKDEDLPNSPAVKRYLELKTEVESEKFQAYKQMCLDKNRYQKTEQFKQETRLKELENSSAISNYIKYVDTNYFEEQKNWTLAQEESFSSSKLDSKKWIKSLYWAKELGDNLFSSDDELQAFDGDKNIILRNNSLTVVTCKEKGEGKFWDQDSGFINKTTDFTSAVLSSVQSYSSEEGMVKIKMKLSGNKYINHSAWLSTPDNSYSILLYKAQHKYCTVGTLSKEKSGINKSIEEVKIVPFFKDYHIFTVEWNKKEIIWKVNGLEIYKSKNDLKNSQLQLLINSTVTDRKRSGNGDMTIDWIRSYQKIK